MCEPDDGCLHEQEVVGLGGGCGGVERAGGLAGGVDGDGVDPGVIDAGAAEGGGGGVESVRGGREGDLPAGVWLGEPGLCRLGKDLVWYPVVDRERERDAQRRIDAMHDSVHAGQPSKLDVGVDTGALEVRGDRAPRATYAYGFAWSPPAADRECARQW